MATDYRLQDLIDIPKFQSLLDSLYLSSGIPSAIIDLEGNILTGSGWLDICTKFHRVNPETLKDCIHSDVTITAGVSSNKEQRQITCPRGLTDTATPLILEGRHLANVFTGQLFIAQPDREFFRQQARQFNFDEGAYLEAFDKVPRITRKQLDEYLAFIAQLADLLATLGLNRFRRLKAEEDLQSSLRDKEALLKEVHHRVKNNLQVVTSLLRLESGRSALPATRSVLGNMQGRIQSMALLHEALYRSGTFVAVDLGAYLRHLTTQSFRALVMSPGAVQLYLDLASVHVDMDQAMPCGLLVNELVSNSFKHGFPDGRGGQVRVELHLVDGGPQVHLRVSDTGVGLPGDFRSKPVDSLGLQLVSDLARQLGGALDIGPGPAAVFTVTFTAVEPKAPANGA